jgi:precorrin-4/cobalt-precorrin-4 C11-methyltransferase
VPGVSSFTGAAAAINREFTLPGVSQTVILTRVEGRTPVPENENLEALASIGASMAIFLSISMIDKVVEKLRNGYKKNVPIAIVERATWHDQRVIMGHLDDIAEKVKENNITKCAQILVGDFIDSDFEKSLLYDKNFSHMYRDAEDTN